MIGRGEGSDRLFVLFTLVIHGVRMIIGAVRNRCQTSFKVSPVEKRRQCDFGILAKTNFKIISQCIFMSIWRTAKNSGLAICRLNLGGSIHPPCEHIIVA